MSTSALHVAFGADVLARASVRSDYVADAVTGLSHIADDWAALERRENNATVFQTLSWCSAWLSATAHAGRPEHPLFVRVRRHGATVLLWPLCRSRTAGCRILHALGEPATQYCDALVDSHCDRSEAVASAWTLVMARDDVDLVSLRRVRDDAAIAVLPAVIASAPNDRAPFADLSIATGTRQWSTRRRRKLERGLSKLSATGEVAFTRVLDTSGKIRAVERAVAFKRAWMRSRGLWSGGYMHPAADAFTRFLAPDPAFEVFVLKAGTEDVAIESGYALEGTYWCLTRAYNPLFTALSPSHLLGQRTLDYFAQLGLQCYDMLSPCQPFKLDWATGTIGVRDVLVPTTWRGALFARTSELAKPTLKRLLGRIAAKPAQPQD